MNTKALDPPASTLTYRLGRPGIVLASGVTAILINVLIHAIGGAVGASYRFTAATGPAVVDTVTIAGFTAIPLLVGMTVAAIFSTRWEWVIPAALVIAPALELGTILAMVVPTDFDLTSAIALSLCHAALVPVTVAGLLALRRLSPSIARPTGDHDVA